MKKTLIALALISVIIISAGCGKGGTAETSKAGLSETENKPVPEIKFGHVGQDHHSALYMMAEYPEIFKNEIGVYFVKIKNQAVYDLYESERKIARIHTIKVGGGSKMPAAVEQGSIETGFGGAAPQVFQVDKGLKGKIIAPLQTEGDMLVMGTETGCPATDWKSWVAWVKKRSAPVKIGYKAPVAVAKLIFERALKEENLEYADVGSVGDGTKVVLVNMRGGKNMIPGLKKRAVDGIVMNQPIPAKSVYKGVGRVVCELADLPPEGMWKDHVCCSMFAKTELVEKHPEVMKALLKMILLAGRKMRLMPKEAAEATNRWTRNGIEVERISVPTIVYSSVPSKSWIEGMRTWAGVMKEIGKFSGSFKDKTPEEVVKDVCDFRLLFEAWRELRKKNLLPAEPGFEMP